MDLEAIRELVRLLKENNLAEIEVESEGERVHLRAETPPPHPVSYHEHVSEPARIALNAPVEAAPAAAAAAEITSTVIIKSPIVGTYYHAASPDKPPFVLAGDAIDENSVLCIIEAMKVMNEIKAEMRGKVREILAENGQPVEFGQPLFAIEPISDESNEI
jgi:acetyl-CoA carboxylase biotin carboxyl carrier protein